LVGIIQGLQEFKKFTFQNVIYSFLKFAFSFLFVFIGFGLVGAIAGLALSPLFTGLICVLWIHLILKNYASEEMSFDKKTIKYGFGLLFSNLLMLLLLTTDTILIPNFFKDYDVGIYISAVTLGRTVYFFPTAIVFALFPMVVESHVKGQSTKNYFFKALLIAFLMSLTGSLIFYFTPEFWIKYLYGERYINAANILKYIGFMLIPMTLVYILISYEIAKNRFTFIGFMFIALIIQGSLIFLFHDNFYAILTVLFAVSSGLFIILSIFSHMRQKLSS
jgi:O-antigen/teichoic acid export membrane protein